MRIAAAVGIALIAASQVFAEDPTGCDKFKFPVDSERAALVAAGLPTLASGADAKVSAAEAISLQTLADAKLPKPPEREQKAGTFAGFVNLGPLAAGAYTIVVSDYAWIDVVQGGAYLKPTEFSGVKGCDGARKAMKFNLSAGPATIQLSGVAQNSIKLAVFPSR